MDRPWWVFALGAAGFAALTTIFGKLGVERVSSNLATALRTVVILVVAWGIVLVRNEQVQITGLSRRTLLFLVLSGLATGLSWLCYFRALQLGKAAQVASVDKLSLVFTLVLAALFLAEPLTWKTIAGTVCIVIGTVLFIA